MSCFFDVNNVINMMLRFILSMFLHNTDIAIESSSEPDDEGKCELVGTFSLVTQAFLGLLCMSSLIVKRYYEWPTRRTWPVWFFDVSKQLLGALGVHIFNVSLSIILTHKDDSTPTTPINKDDGGDDWSDDRDDDPCNWYFLNIVFDCTIGVYVLYLIFGVVNKICKDWLHITNIKSGEYGDPNKPSVTAYLKQLAIYYVSLMITKIVLFFSMNIFSKQLVWITAHILLGWLDDYPDEFEIFIVIFVVPIFMNCLQLILVDNIIQNPYLRRRNKMQSEILESDSTDTENTITNDETNIIDTNKTYGTFE